MRQANTRILRLLLPILTGLPMVVGSVAYADDVASEASTTEAYTNQVLLTDFTKPDLNARWFVRNDNVMGGRSLGQMSIDAGIMTMTGRINTNGGGFTSVMMDVTKSSNQNETTLPTFKGARGLQLQIRASDTPVHRPWRLRVRDDEPRRRGIN